MHILTTEGTTTNGDFLLPFKTGAFLSKAPVHPVILRYPYQRFSPAWDTISGVSIFMNFSIFFSLHKSGLSGAKLINIFQTFFIFIKGTCYSYTGSIRHRIYFILLLKTIFFTYFTSPKQEWRRSNFVYLMVSRSLSIYVLRSCRSSYIYTHIYIPKTWYIILWIEILHLSEFFFPSI